MRLLDTDNNNPYPGLRPYDEAEKDNFFGRDKDCRILNDKILDNSLTLLFAASGVGKSSLLKAAVIPTLNDPLGENVNVVYYIDWVSDPLMTLKQTVFDHLQQQDKLDTDAVDKDILTADLTDFFEFCCLFISQPLVLILDQFEEFFRYQRSKNIFQTFIKQLTAVILSHSLPVSVVISMREDYALELNAFKPRLPMMLFENYYRLEKLGRQAATDAILIPAENHGFRYEEGLFEQLLTDLLSPDFDRSQGLMVADRIETVAPPYLQIVCSQLWQRNQHDAEKIIRFDSYIEAGGAKGLVKNHLDTVQSHFSSADKQLASQAFDHLISRSGTKMAYTAAGLAKTIGVDAQALQQVLEKLTTARVLRSQQRKQVVWYELYHDMFSEGIEIWNSAWKKRMMMRRFMTRIGVVALAGAVLFVGYDFYSNKYSTHLQMHRQEASSRVELYQGKAGSLDLFQQARFLAQLGMRLKDREPDKRSAVYPVVNSNALYTELTGTLPLKRRVTGFAQDGQFKQAIAIADDPTPDTDIVRSQAMLFGLSNLYTQKAANQLLTAYRKANNEKLLEQIEASSVHYFAYLIANKKLLPQRYPQQRRLLAMQLGKLVITENEISLLAQLSNDKDEQVRLNAIASLGETGIKTALDVLQPLLNNNDAVVRRNATQALGNTGDKTAVPALIERLNDNDNDVRRYVANALGKIGDKTVVPAFIERLNDNDVRRYVANALGKIGDKTAVPALIEQLNDNDNDVRHAIVYALGKIGDKTAVPALIEQLKDNNKYVKISIAEALSKIGDKTAVPALIEQLNDSDNILQMSVALALGNIGGKTIVPALIERLNDNDVRGSIAYALGKIGDKTAVPALIERLNDNDVQFDIANALGEIGDKTAVPALIELLNDNNDEARGTIALTLGKIGDKTAVPALIERLNDSDNHVQVDIAYALGDIGDKTAVHALIERLNDDDEFIRSSIARALGKIGDKTAVPVLIERLNDNDVRDTIANALGKIGDKTAVPALIERLNDDDKKVRQNITEALGKIGDKTAVPALIERLHDNDEDVQPGIAEALDKIDAKTAIPILLIKQLKTGVDAINVINSLQNTNAQQALPKLYPLKNHNKTSISKAAQQGCD